MRADTDVLLVQDMLQTYLNRDPGLRALSLSAPAFALALDVAVTTLSGVVETLRVEGLPSHVAATLVRETVPRIVPLLLESTRPNDRERLAQSPPLRDGVWG